MLEIVHVRRVQDTIDKELEMSRVQELDAQVNEWSDRDNVKLQVLDPIVETRNRVPNSNPERVRVRYESNHRAPNVPHSNHKEQCAWQSMTFERSHLSVTSWWRGSQLDQFSSLSDYCNSESKIKNRNFLIHRLHRSCFPTCIIDSQKFQERSIRYTLW